MKTKLFIIGIDGATLDFILPAVKEGQFPNFGRFLKEGVYGELISTRPPMTCPAWPAFMTGKNPGKFGVADFIISQSNDSRVVNATDIKAQAFWDIAGSQGLSAIVVNVPITYPPKIKKGILLSGMLTPRGEIFCSDQNVIADIEDNIGAYQVDLDIMSLSTLEKQRSLKKLYRLTHNQFQTLKYLSRTYPFNILVGVFQLTDIVCHRLWQQKGEVLKAYQKMDEYLRWFDQKGTNVFIVSDHGFKAYSKRILINQYLQDMGLLVSRPANAQDGITRGSSKIQELRFGGRKNVTQNIFRFSKAAFLALGISRNDIEAGLKKMGLFDFLRDISPNFFKRLLPPSLLDVDYSRSMAYLHSGRTRSIVINKNLVLTSAAYEQLRNRLKRKLLELKDPGTGEKVISQVFFREEIYSGKYLDTMPDLYLEAAQEYLIRSGFGKNIISNFPVPKPQHDPAGIIFAKGPDIRSGRMISGASIIDLAPTMLHLLGLAVPEDMDGRVLREIFNEDSEARRREVRYTASVEKQIDPEVLLSMEQEQMLKERLRGLGYLD